MKGFLHIVEVIIVAMLVFVILSQFYSIPKADPSWGTPKLTVMSQDLLYTLDASGVDWSDAAEVNHTLYYLVPRTMSYSLSLNYPIRPRMRIGCVCDDVNYSILESGVLSDFTVNGIQRRMVHEQIEPYAFTLNEAQMGNDVILICGNVNVNGVLENRMGEYLSRGNGIVHFANLTSDVVESSWHSLLFNLEWVYDSESVPPPSGEAYFPYAESSEKRYMIEKIFTSMPPAPAGFNGFNNFVSESVYPAEGNPSRILVRQGLNYIGGSYEGRYVPLSVINWGVNGTGRTAWMSWAGISKDTQAENENKQLLKSLIVWAASGKDYPIITNRMNQGAKASMRKVFNEDMYETVKVELSVGYHF